MVKYVHDATGEEIEWDDVDESSVDSLADSDGYWSLEDNARGLCIMNSRIRNRTKRDNLDLVWHWMLTEEDKTERKAMVESGRRRTNGSD